MAKIDLRCTTASCVDAIAKYGEHYHSVHHVEKAAEGSSDVTTARCERCGGFHNGIEWTHTCKACGKSVEPGELRGFFVPHRCAECDGKVVAQQTATGKICRRCNTVMAYCCC